MPPPDLDGRTYTVVFPTEDKKPKEKLIFKDGKLTLDEAKLLKDFYMSGLNSSTYLI
mgnify:CR=1 FL=1